MRAHGKWRGRITFPLVPVMRPLASFCLAATVLVASAAGAAPVKTDHVEAELVAREASLQPGAPAILGLRLKMDRHWHTYWQNPGDSGAPTSIAWKLPQGFEAGAIRWPAPQRIPVPPLMNYGYEGEIVLPVELAVPKALPAGTVVRLAARADWLVCSDICIPGGADLELAMPVEQRAVAANPRWAALFARAAAGTPVQAVAGARATTNEGWIELVLPGVKPAANANVYVYAGIEGLVEHAARQGFRQTDEGMVAKLAVSRQLAATGARISGVVTGAGAAPLAFDAPMAGKLVPGSAPSVMPEAAPLSAWLAIAFALVGGLILNLMPCVFPVLSLKVIGFANAAAERRSMRLQGFAFAAGVIGSFVALAGLMLALRAAGEAVGWGFQLQSPLVVSLLALLFFVLALNLSGVFEFASLVPARLAGASIRHPVLDALFSGVIAALVASPCTAPFMGAAIGYALTQDPLAALSVFVAMGVGMALPYVLLSLFPAWARHLPRPGPWLATFKQVMAFPLYATVVWLAWVLLVQVGADGIVRLGAGLVLAAFALWLLGRARGATGRVAAGAALALALWAAYPPPALPPDVAGSTSAQQGWAVYSSDEIMRLNAAGKAVFVDFTAAWCVTCQVNKKVVLESRSVREAFASSGLALMRADWTRRDPQITAALAEFGRNGVPVYALYLPGKAPRLLPEILSERIILDALAGLKSGPK
jgi:thiol:disulfide interchange protein